MADTTSPIDNAALADALGSAIENAVHWRDYGNDDEAAKLWDADAELLERAMPLLLAAQELRDALIHVMGPYPTEEGLARARAAIARAAPP